MNESELFTYVLFAALGLAVVTALYLSFATAPYGRHARRGYGPSVSNGLGWVIMESPAALVPIVLTLVSGRRDVISLSFLLIWETHYLYRAFVYPVRIRGRGAPMPLLVPLSGASFNVLNAYLNFRGVSAYSPQHDASWLYDPRFVLGCALFVVGIVINRRADRILLSLRAPGETGYKVPHGSLYAYVSCPNYFGELVQWTGWALATWALPGLFFALFSAANLVPRAVAHHRDYRRRFPDYPPERRAVIPFVL